MGMMVGREREEQRTRIDIEADFLGTARTQITTDDAAAEPTVMAAECVVEVLLAEGTFGDGSVVFPGDYRLLERAERGARATHWP